MNTQDYQCVIAGFIAIEAALPAHRARLWRTGRQTALNLWPVLPTAFVVMLVWWPWAQQNPIGHPLEALVEFSHFPMEFDFAFFGTWLSTADLPWYYIPAFLAVKLPEPMVLLLVAEVKLLVTYVRGGVVSAMPELAHAPADENEDETPGGKGGGQKPADDVLAFAY